MRNTNISSMAESYDATSGCIRYVGRPRHSENSNHLNYETLLNPGLDYSLMKNLAQIVQTMVKRRQADSKKILTSRPLIIGSDPKALFFSWAGNQLLIEYDGMIESDGQMYWCYTITVLKGKDLSNWALGLCSGCWAGNLRRRSDTGVLHAN